MNLLFVGDVVGKSGRETLRELLPDLRREYNCQIVVANVENMAGGSGVTGKCLKELTGVVDVFTAGDHVWDQKGFDNEITMFNNFLRPANNSQTQPGRGFAVFRNPGAGEFAFIVLMGKVFMKESAYCPFETVDKILKEIPATVKSIFVDFHAEATSEKLAMGYYLDGRVTAVFGTHTHVQTADATVLNGGTARITDVGMTGAVDSVLGRSIEDVLEKFRTGMPRRLNVVESGKIRLDGAVVNYNHLTGKAEKITPISKIAVI